MKPDWYIKFFKHVQITDKCWNWTGPKTEKGYGIFHAPGLGNRAHRVSYAYFIGDIPEESVICHSCDNKGCVNPDHLSAETIAENNFQARDRGLWKPLHGEANGNAKLSTIQVFNLRMMHRIGFGCYRLSKFFGITPTHAWRIFTGKQRKSEDIWKTK